MSKVKDLLRVSSLIKNAEYTEYIDITFKTRENVYLARITQF